MSKLADRKLDDPHTGPAIERMLLAEAHLLEDPYSTNAEWRIVDLADVSLRLPFQIDLPTAQRLIGHEDATLKILDEQIEEALTEADVGHEEIPLDAADGLLGKRLPLVDAATSCDDLADTIKGVVSDIKSALDFGLPGRENTGEPAVLAVIEQCGLFGDMPPAPSLRSKAAAALIGYYDAERQTTVDAYATERATIRADVESEHADRVQAIKEGVVEYVVRHLPEFVTAERNAPVNPVAVHLAGPGGLTLQQIGDAYGVSRQGASHYVQGARKAPPLEGETGALFYAKLREYRDAHHAQLAAICQVIDGKVT